MSYVLPYYTTDPPATADLVGASVSPRSPIIPLLFIPPTVICAIAWLTGGASRLTDLGFLLLALVSAWFLVSELIYFPHRCGIGGLLLFGGVLIWFCHDYFSNWFLRNFNDPSVQFSSDVVAKAAFLHCFFVLCMSMGLFFRGGRWAQRAITWVPEPRSNSLYLWLVLILLALGLTPYFFFTHESPLTSLMKAMFSGWMGRVQWTTGRTGTINTSWGGYLAQLLQIGQVGGILAAFYALVITRNLMARIMGWSIWLFWALQAFESGRRGELTAMVLPVAGLLFIKYQTPIYTYVRRHNFRAYFVIALLALIFLFAVQFQGTFRGVGFSQGSFREVELTKSRGNAMFSEGLVGYVRIPVQRNFFYDDIPGEAVLRPIPDALWNFAIGPIPRALWTTKPVDPVWQWYNEVATGRMEGKGAEGTTISQGLVGHWYFRYGIIGIIEGGLLVGWLMGVTERALQNSQGRPMALLMSLGVATWLFRAYRNFIFIDLYGLLIGTFVFAVLVYMLGAAPRNQLERARL